MNKASINRLKLFVIVLFVFPLGFFFFYKNVENKVSGQSGLASLSAPTDMTATDGIYSTKVGLRWDTMRGATLYRIFRGTSADSTAALSIGTTQANSFFDLSAPQGQTFFYWVRSENTGGTSGLSQLDQGFRANGTISTIQQPLEPPNATGRKSDYRDQGIARQSAFLGRTAFLDPHGRLRNLSFGRRRRSR